MGFRTINQALAILKSHDEDTALTSYYLRVLCKTGQIMTLNVGSKFLINMESLCQFLNLDLNKIN
ncbi:MAG: hypothetical protein IJW59_00580 [Clostridia bacterium]|nr:hypothetical protein [Clostridia bacterium]